MTERQQVTFYARMNSREEFIRAAELDIKNKWAVHFFMGTDTPAMIDYTGDLFLFNEYKISYLHDVIIYAYLRPAQKQYWINQINDHCTESVKELCFSRMIQRGYLINVPGGLVMEPKKRQIVEFTGEEVLPFRLGDKLVVADVIHGRKDIVLFEGGSAVELHVFKAHFKLIEELPEVTV